MFENMLNQSAVTALAADIQNAAFPPSALFCGPPASGKASAALECARVLSCAANAASRAANEASAPWTCDCPSCVSHRGLISKDLLIIGSRPFGAEILACSQAFLRDWRAASARTLFLRSVRKLLLRFSPVIWEGNAEVSKFNTLLESLNDSLDALCVLADADTQDGGPAANENGPAAAVPKAFEKLAGIIVRDALKLEAAGISDTIPVLQIRRASYWLRHAPDSKRKTLVIENADRMKDEARNSLLKTIEEPPPSSQIILCSAKPSALLPTILSRLRPYAFTRRDAATEAEIIRRVFRDSEAAARMAAADAQNGSSGSLQELSLVEAYLDGFLPVPKQTLNALAALFVCGLASRIPPAAANETPCAANETPCAAALACLAETGKQAALAGGFDGKPDGWRAVCVTVFEKAGKFQSRRLFAGFIEALYALVSESLKTPGKAATCGSGALPLRALIRKHADGAVNAVTVYNLNALTVLEKLFLDIQADIASL